MQNNEHRTLIPDVYACACGRYRIQGLIYHIWIQLYLLSLSTPEHYLNIGVQLSKPDRELPFPPLTCSRHPLLPGPGIIDIRSISIIIMIIVIVKIFISAYYLQLAKCEPSVSMSHSIEIEVRNIRDIEIQGGNIYNPYIDIP
ncbi:hypothetical protein DFH27DRAFT_603773 [Peziza echinospora]|nr:hypothetical protein DFH27DRAFT_603773 [Peziza echinospora]